MPPRRGHRLSPSIHSQGRDLLSPVNPPVVHPTMYRLPMREHATVATGSTAMDGSDGSGTPTPAVKRSPTAGRDHRPHGDPLQLHGGATHLTAPASPTTLTFQLTVNNGQLTGSPAGVTITVPLRHRHQHRRPGHGDGLLAEHLHQPARQPKAIDGVAGGCPATHHRVGHRRSEGSAPGSRSPGRPPWWSTRSSSTTAPTRRPDHRPPP